VDTAGYWEGNQHFSFHHALFVYNAKIKRTNEEYEVFANYFIDSVIGDLGNRMWSQNLGVNLLILMTYQTTFTTPGNKDATDTFLFTANPTQVYTSGVYSAGLGTVDSLCDIDPSISYDRANAKMNIVYDYSTITNSTACTTALDPKHLGYDPLWSGGDFSVAIGE
jgi:hypothetical protein